MICRRYTNPELVREQLKALHELGLRSETASPLNLAEPALGTLWELEQEDKFAYDRLSSEQITELAPKLQRIALESFREAILTEGDGQETLDWYRRAFLDLPELSDSGMPLRDSHLAFHLLSEEEADTFWGELQEKLVAETSESVDILGCRFVTFTPRIWAGLDEKAKYAVAGVTLYHAFKNYGVDPSVVSTAASQGTAYIRDLLSVVVAPHAELEHAFKVQDELWARVAVNDGRLEMVFEVFVELTQNGFKYMLRLVDDQIDELD